MQQTLKLIVRGGYLDSVGPWNIVPSYLLSQVPDSRTSWADLRLSDIDVVQQLNNGGWKTLSVVVYMENGRYVKEIWLTREVKENHGGD